MCVIFGACVEIQFSSKTKIERKSALRINGVIFCHRTRSLHRLAPFGGPTVRRETRLPVGKTAPNGLCKQSIFVGSRLDLGRLVSHSRQSPSV